MTPAQIDKMVELASVGTPKTVIASELGLSQSLFRRILIRDKHIRDKYEAAELIKRTNGPKFSAIVFGDAEIALVSRLAGVLTHAQLADFFGIGSSTLVGIMERQPEVREAYNIARAKVIGSIATTLVQQARDGNLSAAIFYLKTQGGWSEKSQVELSGSVVRDVVFVPADTPRPSSVSLEFDDED